MDPQSHSAAGRIMSVKNLNDPIGNRTRDLLLVAQCLNQLRHRVLTFIVIKVTKFLGSIRGGNFCTSSATVRP